MAAFHDRAEAGVILAQKLRSYAGHTDVLVLGLPRGGIPVAFEVARALGAPLYRHGRTPLKVHGKTVILVDDGLATGASMHAAAVALRTQEPAKIVVAVPVAAAETRDEFRRQVDEIVCAVTPEPFRAVGLWYENFDQTTDEEVREVLDRAAARQPLATGPQSGA
jgi:predicted phosphoribosyltransferase